MKLTLDKAANVMRITTYTAVLIMLPVVAFKVLPLLERAVGVLENMDKRIDRAVKGLAPLGREGVDKGIDTIKSMDGKKIGEDLTNAIRRRLKRDK
jgi:hypothetical protein